MDDVEKIIALLKEPDVVTLKKNIEDFYKRQLSIPEIKEMAIIIENYDYPAIYRALNICKNKNIKGFSYFKGILNNLKEN